MGKPKKTKKSNVRSRGQLTGEQLREAADIFSKANAVADSVKREALASREVARIRNENERLVAQISALQERQIEMDRNALSVKPLLALLPELEPLVQHGSAEMRGIIGIGSRISRARMNGLRSQLLAGKESLMKALALSDAALACFEEVREEVLVAASAGIPKPSGSASDPS